MEYKPILKVVPGLMATGLMANNLKLMPKMKMGKGRMKMKPVSSKRLVKVGVTNLIGIPLIGATASMIK